MATVDERMHVGDDLLTRSASQRRHGRDSLAEVVSIRSHRAQRTGLLGSLVTLARGLTSLRAQAPSARSTPHPPSSPALLSMVPAHAPDDAA